MTPPPPSPLLALTELPRALGDYARLGFAFRQLREGAGGDGHPVLVIPGFIANDRSTAAMRRILRLRGYDARGWELGRNFGPKTIGGEAEHLVARLRAIHAETGRRVTLVGWSLGGIMARLLAAWHPELVRQVVTLGSPYAGSPRATNVWRLYEWCVGQSIDDAAARGLHAASAARPRVPTTAIYSRADGIVSWRICHDGNSHEAVEVRGSHIGLAANPQVIAILLDRLAQEEGAFQRYAPPVASGWSAAFTRWTARG